MTEAVRPSSRLSIVDAARGTALAAMFVYHFVWDLGFFRVVPPEMPASPGFKFFGHIIAGSFLALVGISHALATRNGIKWKPWAFRLSMIIATAALITLVTYYLFPESYIFFGILHCIVVGSLLALLFTRVPWPITALVGLAIILGPIWASERFDPVNWWLGLGFDEPRTNDWRPVFPWSGFALVGLALAQAIPFERWPAGLLSWRERSRLSRWLVQGGRHSLLVYLVHQPVLLAIAFLLSLFFVQRQLPQTTPTAAFQNACEARCLEVQPNRQYCTAACSCVVKEAQTAGLWDKVLRNTLEPGERVTYDALTQQCVRRANPEISP